MDAKKLVHACVGLLILALVLELGASFARGQTAGFRVIGPNTVVIGEAVYHLDTLNPPFGWHQLPEGNFNLPPVSPSSLVNYESGQYAITDQGEGWGKVGGVWTDLGPIPGVMSVRPATWGQVKATYRH